MFEFISFLLFVGLVSFGVTYLFRAKSNSEVRVSINNQVVSTLKTLDDYVNELLVLAHRRAAVESMPNISKKIVEIRLIDDELINISKQVTLLGRKHKI
ncbi:MAG: hypothetical protein HRT38_10265 [Alteromonadaceae bacterium]|nr:hypothetical protein [Alteromonadaceae bacterium]